MPESLAEQAVAKLNAADGSPNVVLTGRISPHFDRYLFFSVDTNTQTLRIEMHLMTGGGAVRTEEREKDEDDEESANGVPRNFLGDLDKLELPENTYSIAKDEVPTVLEELGLESGEPSSGRSSTSLIFSAEVDGVPCKVQYNLASGGIAAFAYEAPRSEMTLKSFSQRLHLSRGYAPSMGTRIWWAISVDAIFFSMVFWAFPGIFMCWQIKQIRTIGFVTCGQCHLRDLASIWHARSIIRSHSNAQ